MSYNGQDITYDGIGNPISYYNGFTFSWQGRRLVGATRGSDTLSFTYNDDGIRTSKTVNGVKTTYYLSGSQILAEVTPSYEIMYIYDASGSPVGMQYRSFTYANGVYDVYFFEKNLQGDILAVYSAEGVKLISYEYDAWGNFATTYHNGGENTSAVNNRFTYRGYYYDSDLGMYYLSARYYDQNIKRFLSPDATAVVSVTPMALTDKNLFAYCDNNPIIRVDNGGQFWETVFDVISLGASIVEVCINPTDIWAWAGLVGDAIDLIPFVTGVGEVTRTVKTTVKIVDKTTDVVDTAKTIYKTDDVISDICKATGSYEILYKSGKNYIGKGGFKRAISSAARNATEYGDEVTSIIWKSAPDSKAAFIDEYLMQKRFGGVLSSNRNLPTYNKIWSPGRRYFG